MEKNRKIERIKLASKSKRNRKMSRPVHGYAFTSFGYGQWKSEERTSQSIPHHISFGVWQIKTKAWNKSKLNLWDQIILLCFILYVDLHVQFLSPMKSILVLFVHLFYLHILSRVLPMMSIFYIALPFFFSSIFNCLRVYLKMWRTVLKRWKKGNLSVSTGERGNVLWFCKTRAEIG